MRWAIGLAAAIGCAGSPPSTTPVSPEPAASPLADGEASLAEPEDENAEQEISETETEATGDDAPPAATQAHAARPAAVDAHARVGAPVLVEGEVWLKGSTHVHARASGDSTEATADVVAWYEDRHYDFIALTDHNRVSELDDTRDTRGQITLRDPRAGMIVLSGIELTHNPVGCLPAGDPSGNCRIHVNLLGPVARPGGRLEWAERRSHARLDMYRAAQIAQVALGGIAQINHPQWMWGMTPDLLAELARRGTPLVEIANSAFAKWDAGDASHPSTEALWDAALARGVTLWGVASDDAHDYRGHGKWPPGGGWVVVRARRDPRAILEALAAGRFYASTGVALARAEVERGELVVEVDPADAGTAAGTTIEFIENGRRLDAQRCRVARRAIPPVGYLRAVVTRDDGKRAWVQPVRR